MKGPNQLFKAEWCPRDLERVKVIQGSESDQPGETFHPDLCCGMEGEVLGVGETADMLCVRFRMVDGNIFVATIPKLNLESLEVTERTEQNTTMEGFSKNGEPVYRKIETNEIVTRKGDHKGVDVRARAEIFQHGTLKDVEETRQVGRNANRQQARQEIKENTEPEVDENICQRI